MSLATRIRSLERVTQGMGGGNEPGPLIIVVYDGGPPPDQDWLDIQRAQVKPCLLRVCDSGTGEGWDLVVSRERSKEARAATG